MSKLKKALEKAKISRTEMSAEKATLKPLEKAMRNLSLIHI